MGQAQERVVAHRRRRRLHREPDEAALRDRTVRLVDLSPQGRHRQQAGRFRIREDRNVSDAAPRHLSNRPLKAARRPAKKVRAKNTHLLREIGYVVRNERAKRGMTRKMLAKQANMSDRFLAQIELGLGNPSVLSLDAIARALTLDVFVLLPAVSFDEARRRAFVHLRQLPVSEVKDFLNAFAHAKSSLPSARGKRIALVGLRGAGKSTL